MAHLYKDEDSGIIHIRTNADICLCGLMEGWTTTDKEKAKKRYGCTCFDCQCELQNLKKLKLK